ncbi:MBL fold metallo-hydrolase [Thalassobacillus devorans]|uniref:MBL fold metallo-hydrolase n=1 Tax=Thalassobacillus devorans TaxID=279813 RepID=A0ABQ1NF91_9BACI|nr:MBL fold metallo-hydrolase [Thalassobacillus devorans]NIK27101.1 glyoxylase-like metal-dependent hydrolase (beta-lactamase superfamily II) [Thalassobacillus devorans]GGC74934.1 MBL fold metallo-hydrolase [Thalassobacillus devorans]
MEMNQINAHCYYFHSAVNIGYVHNGEEGMIIDAGIDKSAIKKVIKGLKEHALPVTHLFITHAHADHYGGAQYLQENFDVLTIAPKFESAILENPSLEPLYLFGGNDPLDELKNKFLEGPPVRIDDQVGEGSFTFGTFDLETYLLPGHSYHQLAVKVFDVLYAADSYFEAAQLEKHKIPYITDAALTIESLERLKEIPCDGAVPGHGKYETDFKTTVQKNIDYHVVLLTWLENYIDEHPNGVSHENIIAAMCDSFGVENNQLGQWLLYRTAVTAYLIGAVKEETISYAIEGNRWMFKTA